MIHVNLYCKTWLFEKRMFVLILDCAKSVYHLMFWILNSRRIFVGQKLFVVLRMYKTIFGIILQSQAVIELSLIHI